MLGKYIKPTVFIIGVEKENVQDLKNLRKAKQNIYGRNEGEKYEISKVKSRRN